MPQNPEETGSTECRLGAHYVSVQPVEHMQPRMGDPVLASEWGQERAK